jgi:membrane protein involved in colicin uptake
VKNRFMILGLASFLAVALAVPALGGPSNPVADGAASAKKTATKALKQARKAKTLAKNAQTSADSAQATADAAQTSANDANTAAGNAQTTADAATTAAADAQTAADAAQATADSKFGSINNVEGDPSPSDNSDKSLIFATCSGDDAATGGGFIVSGTGANDSHVTFNSGYIDSWGVAAEDGGSNASNWSITPTVRCAAP